MEMCTTGVDSAPLGVSRACMLYVYIRDRWTSSAVGSNTKTSGSPAGVGTHRSIEGEKAHVPVTSHAVVLLTLAGITRDDQQQEVAPRSPH
ncbi:hypothetical protein KM043_018431 [Ampulex compressa]|nr:hypothetical protein KM043_018431 [Ampulex compressa]